MSTTPCYGRTTVVGICTLPFQPTKSLAARNRLNLLRFQKCSQCFTLSQWFPSRCNTCPVTCHEPTLPRHPPSKYRTILVFKSVPGRLVDIVGSTHGHGHSLPPPPTNSTYSIHPPPNPIRFSTPFSHRNPTLPPCCPLTCQSCVCSHNRLRGRWQCSHSSYSGRASSLPTNLSLVPVSLPSPPERRAY